MISPLTDLESIADTEAAVLAAAIRREDVREILLAAATPDWWLDLEHRRIFTALRSLVTANAPIDSVSLMRQARAGRASLADVPVREEWIFRAVALGNGITGDSLASTHLPVLRKAFQLRQIDALQGEIAERVTHAGSPDEVLAWLAARCEAIGEQREIDSVLRDPDAIAGMLEGIEENVSEAATLGTLTGIPELDEREFRIKPRQALVIGARPSHGKSSLAMEIAIGVAPKIGVAYYALEDGVHGWQDRRAMMLTGELAGRVRYQRASKRAYQILNTYVQVARERDLPLWVFDNDRNYTAYEILGTARRLKRKNPSLGAVFIDQCYDITGWQRRGGGRDEAPNQIIGELVAGLRELDVCPVFVQQLNREGAKAMKNAEPSMADFADADVFAKRARQILLVWRPNFDEAEGDDHAIIKIEKNTHGKRGKVEVPWDGARVRLGSFEDPLQIAAEGYGRKRDGAA